jgi:hypothetical protein
MAVTYTGSQPATEGFSCWYFDASGNLQYASSGHAAMPILGIGFEGPVAYAPASQGVLTSLAYWANLWYALHGYPSPGQIPVGFLAAGGGSFPVPAAYTSGV